MVDYRSDKLVLSGTTFTLGQGNYDADEMTANLNTLLTGYTVTYSNIKNMITISHSNSFTIDSSSTCLLAYSLGVQGRCGEWRHQLRRAGPPTREQNPRSGGQAPAWGNRDPSPGFSAGGSRPAPTLPFFSFL